MMTVNAREAFGLINQIYDRIQFVPDLSDNSLVQSAVDDLINRISFLQSIEEFYEAIAFTVHQGHLDPVALDISGRRHSEAQILDFLARLARRLDELRPWPRPAFVKLDIGHWNSFAAARPIARINCPRMEISGILNSSFDTVPAGADELPVMILELRSGDVVALAGSADPRSTVFALMARDPRRPGEVLTRFCEFTGFTLRDIVSLVGNQ